MIINIALIILAALYLLGLILVVYSLYAFDFFRGEKGISIMTVLPWTLFAVAVLLYPITFPLIFFFLIGSGDE